MNYWSKSPSFNFTTQGIKGTVLGILFGMFSWSQRFIRKHLRCIYFPKIEVIGFIIIFSFSFFSFLGASAGRAPSSKSRHFYKLSALERLDDLVGDTASFKLAIIKLYQKVPSITMMEASGIEWLICFAQTETWSWTRSWIWKIENSKRIRSKWLIEFFLNSSASFKNIQHSS